MTQLSHDTSLALFVSLGVAVALVAIVIACYLNNAESRRDMERIRGVQQAFVLCIEKVKKGVAEMQSVFVEMQEVLSGERGGEKEPDALKARVKEKVDGIREAVCENLKMTSAFMKDLCDGKELKALDRDRVESFKDEIRQMQFTMKCLEDHVVSLESSYAHMDRIKDPVAEKDEAASSICGFRKALHDMTVLVHVHDAAESLKRIASMSVQNHWRHRPYYIARHSHGTAWWRSSPSVSTSTGRSALGTVHIRGLDRSSVCIKPPKPSTAVCVSKQAPGRR